jgi:hypothetical protein
MSKYEINKSIDDFIKKSDEKIYKLQIELIKMEVSKNIYKERMYEIHNCPTNKLYVLTVFNDISGCKNESCIGVFKLKSKAYKYILDNEFYYKEFSIEKYDVSESVNLDKDMLVYVLYKEVQVWGENYDVIENVSIESMIHKYDQEVYWQQELKLM